MNEVTPQLLALIVVIVVLALSVIGIVYLITRPRTKSIAGSMTTTVFGATDGFLTKDKKAAVEIMTEIKAKKKMEEQSSKEPKNKDDKKD